MSQILKIPSLKIPSLKTGALKPKGLPAVRAMSEFDTIRACLEGNVDFIRGCHVKLIPAVDIVQYLGIHHLSKSAVYPYFSAAKVGRSHLGFEPLASAHKSARLAVFADYRAAVSPRAGESDADFLRAHKNLIEAMHRDDVKLIDMAKILDIKFESLGSALSRLKLGRHSFGLESFLASHPGTQSLASLERRWSAREDSHIRRGHACGFSKSSVAALCRRGGMEIDNRARHLGLGPWPLQVSSRERLSRAAKYDKTHDLAALSVEDIREHQTGPRGLDKNAEYLK